MLLAIKLQKLSRYSKAWANRGNSKMGKWRQPSYGDKTALHTETGPAWTQKRALIGHEPPAAL